MKNLGWIDQLNQAKIDESKAQASIGRVPVMQRLQTLDWFVLDPMTGTVTQAYQGNSRCREAAWETTQTCWNHGEGDSWCQVYLSWGQFGI